MSGFVFSEKYLNKPSEFIKKRIKSLYIPFVTFETIFLLFHNLFVKIGFYGVFSNVSLMLSYKDFIVNFIKLLTLGYGEQLAGPLWFLISLLEINVIFFLILKLSNKISDKYAWIYCGIIVILLYLVGCYIRLPRMISQSCIGLLFYTFGFFYKKNESKIKFKFIYFMISLITLIFCSIFNIIDISRLMIKYKMLLIVSGLCGTYVVLYLSNKLKFLNNKLILYCGEKTLYILALHCLFFKFVMLIEIMIYNTDRSYLSLFPVYQQNHLWTIIFTVIGTLGPILVKLLIDLLNLKIKNYLKKLNYKKIKGEI